MRSACCSCVRIKLLFVRGKDERSQHRTSAARAKTQAPAAARPFPSTTRSCERLGVVVESSGICLSIVVWSSIGRPARPRLPALNEGPERAARDRLGRRSGPSGAVTKAMQWECSIIARRNKGKGKETYELLCPWWGEGNPAGRTRWFSARPRSVRAEPDRVFTTAAGRARAWERQARAGAGIEPAVNPPKRPQTTRPTSTPPGRARWSTLRDPR